LKLLVNNKKGDNMTKSYYKQFFPKGFDSLKGNIECDILIIGAGITGLSIAYELLNLNKRIVIVEQNRIYQNTSTSTTAKITAQHGYIYHNFINEIGVENAKLFYNFNTLGIKRIKEIVEKENIDCDFKTLNGFLFSESDDEYNLLLLEQTAYKKLGINTTIVNIDQRITAYPALKLENQANFNVTKYLHALTDVLLNNNVTIYENTRIVSTRSELLAIAKTSEGYNIIARNVISASHYPVFKNFNYYFLKMIPSYSYSVVSPPTEVSIEDANYINVSSASSIAIRYIQTDEGKLLNISGRSHDAKEFKDYFKEIEFLKTYAKKHFGIDKIDYIWETEDYKSFDKLPLVGYLDNLSLVATSYNKWGMAASVASSLVIKDLIEKKDSAYKELLNPKRFKLNCKLLSYNIMMPKTFIKTRILHKKNTINLENETGKVYKINGEYIGIYKDINGDIIKVKAICPHLFCGLKFNNLEKTYDCYCHGSRFDYFGKILDGPTKKDLERL
jgi:glycine/D-amino acid oxidase-like deaminating enzyme/nitrite reductase/ring-hydroxylating ferredoxin subunit